MQTEHEQQTKFFKVSEFSKQEIRRLTVRSPGSSANLGPGFDALALAFQLYCSLSFEVLEHNDPNIPFITFEGSRTEGLSNDQNNLIYGIINKIWSKNQFLRDHARIKIKSEIPMGKGIGSSAAAVIGSIWGAHALNQTLPDNKILLAEATNIEGHADNVSASLLGGLVISGTSSDNPEICTKKLLWPDQWCTLLTVPSQSLSTKKARSVLPSQISFPDAVENIQRVSLLIAAVATQDEKIMEKALHDKLHEPYRQHLAPQLAAIRKHLSDLPVMGTILSGAGSSVLTIVNKQYKNQIIECLEDWFKMQAESYELLDLAVDQEGLKVSL